RAMVSQERATVARWKLESNLELGGRRARGELSVDDTRKRFLLPPSEPAVPKSGKPRTERRYPSLRGIMGQDRGRWSLIAVKLAEARAGWTGSGPVMEGGPKIWKDPV